MNVAFGDYKILRYIQIDFSWPPLEFGSLQSKRALSLANEKNFLSAHCPSSFLFATYWVLGFWPVTLIGIYSMRIAILGQSGEWPLASDLLGL
jgi:hypothetical protein